MSSTIIPYNSDGGGSLITSGSKNITGKSSATIYTATQKCRLVVITDQSSRQEYNFKVNGTATTSLRDVSCATFTLPNYYYISTLSNVIGERETIASLIATRDFNFIAGAGNSTIGGALSLILDENDYLSVYDNNNTAGTVYYYVYTL